MVYYYQPQDLECIADTFHFLRNTVPLAPFVKIYLTERNTGDFIEDYSESIPCFSRICNNKKFLMHINNDKSIYVCKNAHMCKNSGDLLSFVSKWKNVSLVESSLCIIEEFFIDIPQDLHLFLLLHGRD